MLFSDWFGLTFGLVWIGCGHLFWEYCRHNDPKLGTLHGWFICIGTVPKLVFYFLRNLTNG